DVAAGARRGPGGPPADFGNGSPGGTGSGRKETPGEILRLRLQRLRRFPEMRGQREGKMETGGTGMKKKSIIWAGLLVAALALGGCQSSAPQGEAVVFPTGSEAESQTAEETGAEPAEDAEAIRQVEGTEAFGSL